MEGRPSHPHSPGLNHAQLIPMPGRAGWAPQARDNLARSIRRRLAEHGPCSAPHPRTAGESLAPGQGSPLSAGKDPQERGPPHSRDRTPREEAAPQAEPQSECWVAGAGPGRRC